MPKGFSLNLCVVTPQIFYENQDKCAHNRQFVRWRLLNSSFISLCFPSPFAHFCLLFSILLDFFHISSLFHCSTLSCTLWALFSSFKIRKNEFPASFRPISTFLSVIFAFFNCFYHYFFINWADCISFRFVYTFLKTSLETYLHKCSLVQSSQIKSRVIDDLILQTWMVFRVATAIPSSLCSKFINTSNNSQLRSTLTSIRKLNVINLMKSP